MNGGGRPIGRSFVKAQVQELSGAYNGQEPRSAWPKAGDIHCPSAATGTYALASELQTRTDFWLFAVLFALTLLFQLQLLWPPLASLHVRHVLLAYLFARLIIRSRRPDGGIPLPILIFLGLSVAVMIHTAIYDDRQIALAGFARFVNVALLAPLAVGLVITRRRLDVLLTMWFVAIGAGFATALYQAAGGTMEWLVQSYYAGRGEAGQVLRYKTLLGDPNVGGMSAAIAALGGMLLLRGSLARVLVLAAATCAILLSLSKAAVVLFVLEIIALAAIYAASRKHRPPARWSKNVLLTTGLVAPICIIALLQDIGGLQRYTITLAQSVIGTGGYGMDVSAADALFERSVLNVQRGITFLLSGSFHPALTFLIGGSYAIAGSIAVEMRGEGVAFLPHNGYLEVFLVGGVALLASFLWIVIRTVRVLFAVTSVRAPRALFLMLAFAVLIATLVGYPVMYEPVLGSLFWLIVGVAAIPNDRLDAILKAATADTLSPAAGSADPMLPRAR